MAPSLVLALIQRLPSNSLTVALVSGGKHLFEWTPERSVWADIFDAINLNTRATGMWEKKPPDFPPADRPSASGSDTPDEKPKTSVAGLYKQFSGGM